MLGGTGDLDSFFYSCGHPACVLTSVTLIRKFNKTQTKHCNKVQEEGTSVLLVDCTAILCG
jgi:hypothetical protein